MKPLSVVLFLVTFLLSGCNQSSPSSSTANLPVEEKKVQETTTEELKQSLGDREKSNPLDYLDATASMRNNIVGETVFEGSVSNSATVATYKDIEIEFVYKTKTDTELGRESFVLYEFVKAGEMKTFKFKTQTPKSTKDFSFAIKSATPE